MTMPHLQDTLLALYRGCRDRPAAEFREWALDTARGAVSFDSGIWVTADVVSDAFSSTCLFRQPPEMMANYDRTVRLSGDLLAKAAISSPRRTINLFEIMPRRQFIRHPIYLQHCRHYGIEHALCTCDIAPVARVTTFISFYRASPKAAFNEAERRTTELLVPHMIEAMRINLFSHLPDSSPDGGQDRGALAICDADGTIYESTPRFPELLRDAWPDWFGPRLPLADVGLDRRRAMHWSLNGLHFEASPCRDLFLVRVARENLLDRLSPRQVEVAMLLIKGKRYKDIARELGITPATVTKHVNQIHSRLRVDGREALIAAFRPS